jgi:SIR2-like domain
VPAAPRDDLFVLITGAGASRKLGWDGKPQPLMGDWARALRDELFTTAGNAPAALGLTGDITGDKFEQQLGVFLAGVASLDKSEAIMALGADPVSNVDDMHRLLARVRAQAEQVTRAIHKTLFDLFRRDEIAQVAAGQAYGGLLAQLNVTDRLVYATTNYDLAAELAFEQLEIAYFNGERHREAGSRYLSTNIISHRGVNEVPVIHLHGRVGWYRDGDRIRVDPPGPYSADIGLPAVLLPDPSKDPSRETVAGLWDDFELALQNASRVLLLGHSLHDPYLARVLRQRDLATRVAVALHVEGRRKEEVVGEWEHMRAQIPNAVPLPLTFGPELTTHELNPASQDALRAWTVDAQPVWDPKRDLPE